MTQILSLKGHRDEYQPLIERGEIVYCGRNLTMGGWDLKCSIWANPFKGDDAVFKYYLYVRGLLGPEDTRVKCGTPAEVVRRAPELRGKRIGCWCRAKGSESCHTDVLVYLAEGRISDTLRRDLKAGLLKINNTVYSDPLLDQIMKDIAREKYELYKNNEDIAYHAAYRGEIYLLQYLIENKVPFDREKAKKYAQKSGYEATTRFLT